MSFRRWIWFGFIVRAVWITYILADPYVSKTAEFILYSGQIFSRPHPHRSHRLVCAYTLHRHLLHLYKKFQSLKKKVVALRSQSTLQKFTKQALETTREATFSMYVSKDIFSCGFHNWKWTVPLKEHSFRKTWKYKILISKWFIAK